MDNDLVNAVARGIGVEIFSERHGCLCDHATEDLQMNVRGHISLPAIARAAIAAYEAASAARIRELEEELKPFAERSDQWKLNKDSARVSIRLGDLRRARAVLDAKKSPPARASGEFDASEPCRGNGGDSLTDRARPVRNSAECEHD